MGAVQLLTGQATPLPNTPAPCQAAYRPHTIQHPSTPHLLQVGQLLQPCLDVLAAEGLPESCGDDASRLIHVQVQYLIGGAGEGAIRRGVPRGERGGGGIQGRPGGGE